MKFSNFSIVPLLIFTNGSLRFDIESKSEIFCFSEINVNLSKVVCPIPLGGKFMILLKLSSSLRFSINLK